jgi:hypothetical protein
MERSGFGECGIEKAGGDGLEVKEENGFCEIGEEERDSAV